MTQQTHMNFNYLVFIKYIACLYLLSSGGTCNTMDDAKTLLADRLLGYEKRLRPVVNQSQPVEIFVTFELVSIQEFDEVNEKLSITAVLLLSWTDEYITWDPKEYGRLDQLVIESDSVWTPNLVLVNNVNKLEKIGDDWQLIRFLPNGTTYYYPGDVFSASCRVDVTLYPWDRHKCGFQFAAWAQTQTEIKLTPAGDKVLTTYFSENGAWTLYNSSIEVEYGGTSLFFSLYLKRKPMFVIVNVILPIIFMAFLNTMIFLIPVESGERISYSITVLLALAVFLTLVGDNLPKTSSPMSFFGYYLLIVLVISICITLLTILNVRLYYKDESDPVPTWISRFTKCLRCDCRNKRRKRERSSTENITSNRKAKTNTNYILNVEDYGSNKTDSYFKIYRERVYRPMINGRVPYQISSPTNSTDKLMTASGTETDISGNESIISWKDVSLAFDKLFFILSFLVIIVATVSFFAYIYNKNK